MAINPPIDATKTPAWEALQKHYDQLQSEGIDMRKWFAEDSERAQKLSFEAGDLYFDLSKNLIKPETLELLAALAKDVKLDERIKQQYTGVHINNTEDRAVLHTALRRPASDEGKYIVDGQDTVKDVREVLERIYAFANKVRSGEWTGVTGKKIETVVNIGIGGSDLGPVMVYEALKPYQDAGISARYISNIDPNDAAEKLKGLDPETTLFIVASKTFTTLETLTNARVCRAWLLDALKAAGAVDGSDERNAEAFINKLNSCSCCIAHTQNGFAVKSFKNICLNCFLPVVSGADDQKHSVVIFNHSEDKDNKKCHGTSYCGYHIIPDAAADSDNDRPEYINAVSAVLDCGTESYD